MMIEKIPFSVDGIRGLADNFPLNMKGCILLGKALGNYLKESNANPFVMIARDTRPSSPQLYNYVKYGLISKGIQVQDLDIATTPALAYLVKNSSASLGIMITASHNPAKFNGIKIVDSDGKRLSDEANIEKHFRLLDNNDDGYTDDLNIRHNANSNLIDKYTSDQIEQANMISLNGLRLLVDCANGATSHIIPNALRRLGASIQVINRFDGKNQINLKSGTEHVRSHLSEFTTMIQQNNADYGISFDGDGDRLIIVDQRGNFYNGDDFLFILGVLFSRSGNLHKSTLVTTHMANSGLTYSLESFGINLVRTRNGDKYLEQQIAQHNYRLGGEQFGNIMIHDEYHIAADPFYALLYLLKEMKFSELSVQVQSLYKFPQVLATGRTGKKNSANPLDEQVEIITSRLGNGSRVRVWNSSTQPELLNIMVEGTRDCPYEFVLRETRKLCEMAFSQSDSELIIIPLSKST